MRTLSFCAPPVCPSPLGSFLANSFDTLSYSANPSAAHPSFSTFVSLPPPQTTNYATNTSYTLLVIWRSWNKLWYSASFQSVFRSRVHY